MINVTCAIIFHNKRILVTQRGKDMRHPFRWEFPGGKLEAGEDPVACVIREIREELNIEIRVTEALSPSEFDYENFSIRLLPFLAEYKSGEIVLAEHNDYRWLHADELINLDWVEADLPVVEEFLSSGRF